MGVPRDDPPDMRPATARIKDVPAPATRRAACIA